MKKPILTVKEQGFTLIEMAIVLAVLMGMGAVLFSKTTSHYAQVQRVKDATALGVADRQLLHYVAIHGRLPCPDIDGDGAENCAGGIAKGTLPYKTIGLIVRGYASGEVPLRYGVYRKADSAVTTQDSAVSNDADLAMVGNTNRFEPTSSDSCSYDTDTANNIITDSGAPVCPGKKLGNYFNNGFTRKGAMDLCQALENGNANALNSSYTFTRPPTGADNAVAYVLVAPGSVDGDGVNGLFDGLNGSDPAGFNSPATSAQTTYDDQTLARSFTEVSEHLRCASAIRSVQILAEAVAFDDEVKTQQQSMKDQADQAVKDSIMGAVSTSLSLALAIAAVVEASELSTAASVALALHSGICAASLGLVITSCVSIALAAAALGSAGTAVGLAAAAVGLAAGALAAQIAAAILFDQVAQKAGAATNGTPTDAILNAQKQQLASAVNNRDNSYTDYVNENNAAIAARSAATTSATAATTAYTASISTIDPQLVAPAKPTTAPGLTAITALDTAIIAMASYETANSYWKSQQAVADATKLICTQDPLCATTASTSPYATTYDTGNAKYIAWQAAQVTANGALTSLNTAKTNVISKWDVAVQAGRTWDTNPLGGNLACFEPTVSNPTDISPLPLEWWPTYTTSGCVLADNFQTALSDNQQYLAKDKEAARLEASAIQKYNGWQSFVGMAEQTVCGQQKSNYVAGAGVPPNNRAAVVPVWPVVASVTTITEIAATAPQTGTVPQVDSSGVPVFSTGSGTPYSWWGSCSVIATGSGTLISIISGSRAILDQADALGITQ